MLYNQEDSEEDEDDEPEDQDDDEDSGYLLGLLDDELPMAPLGPLRECRSSLVLHISILTSFSSSIMWEVPVPLCVFCSYA